MMQPPKNTYSAQQQTKNNDNTQQRKRKKNYNKLDIFNKVAVWLTLVFTVVCVVVFAVLVNIVNDPTSMQFSKDGLSTVSNSRIYDGDGNLVYEFGEEIRDDVTYDEIPQVMIDAFLSIEDSRYFDHNGFDLPRFMAAALSNLSSGSLGQGGSTLTMQMIDNSFTKTQEEKIKAEVGYLPTSDNIKLKIQEIYLSMVAEQSLSKEDIFEYYINRIWFGSGGNTRGLQKATQYFFNKDVSELNLSEAAFLAGAVNSPAVYNPLNNRVDDSFDYLESATNRRNVTLELMLNHGYISETEYELAVNTKLEFALKLTTTSSDDPNEAYIDQVISEVEELTGQDPLNVPMDIYTALNQDAQKQADLICQNKISDVTYPNDYFDVGFAVIDNSNGEIIAVGPGRTYHTDEVKIDNSTDRKQPGSSMKPLLAYAPTFDLLGWSTVHTVNDVAKDYWKSGTNLNNSDGAYRGLMSLQDALGLSKNTTAAAAMIDLIGVTNTDYWIDYCKKLGYDEDVYESFNEQYSIGGSNMWASPVQQASAYTMLGNGGTRVESHRVRKVTVRTTGDEYQGDSTEYTLISEQAAFMMSVLLEKVVTGGYQNFNEVLQSSYTVYGKSGTSDWGTAGLQYGIPASSIRDEWSLGYTSNYTVATWSGYTAQYFTQGYYPDITDLMYDKTAFHITHYMLDYCEQFVEGGYTEISKPDGIASYNGGYIKSEYASKGDVTSIVSDEKEEEEEEEDTTQSDEEYMTSACEASGGEWDSESQKCWAKNTTTEPEKSAEQIACEASGGTYAGGCVCPTGTTNQSGVCVATVSTPTTSDPPTPDTDVTEPDTTTDPPSDNSSETTNGN
jgi:penicillin-binding protein 1A